MIKLEYWKKNLIGLGVSQFIYRTGSRSLIPFLPIYIKQIGSTNLETTALWSGWILAAPFILSIFTTPLWGSIGDRYGRKLFVILSLIGFSISLFMMSVSASLLLLLLASSMQEIFGGPYPAAISLTSANTPQDKIPDALSFIQFANSLGNIIGPIVGGLLADLIGIKSSLTLMGLIIASSTLLVLFFVKEEKIAYEEQKVSTLKNLKFFFRKKYLVGLGITLLIYTLGVTMMRPGFTLFVSSKFHGNEYSASMAGFFLGLFGAAGSISVLILPLIKKYFSLQFILKTVFITTSVGFFALPFLNNWSGFSTILFVVGFALGLVLPIIYSLISFDTDQNQKAGIISLGSSFQMLGNLTGPIIAGYFIFNFGLKSTYYFTSLIFLMISCVLIFKGRNK